MMQSGNGLFQQGETLQSTTGTGTGTTGDNELWQYKQQSAHGPCPTCGKCRCCDERRDFTPWYTPSTPHIKYL